MTSRWFYVVGLVGVAWWLVMYFNAPSQLVWRAAPAATNVPSTAMPALNDPPLVPWLDVGDDLLREWRLPNGVRCYARYRGEVSCVVVPREEETR